MTCKTNHVASLPPAYKVWKGNVFTGVCHSVHRGGGLPSELGLPSHNDMKKETPSMQTPPVPGRPPCTDPSMQTLQQTPPHSWYGPTGRYTSIVIFVGVYITLTAIHYAIKVIIFNLSFLLIEIENRMLLKMNSISPIISWLAQPKEFSWYFI